MTADERARQVAIGRQEREDQGLPPQVEDHAALARILSAMGMPIAVN